MALRSLIVKMKALPRPVPGARSFATTPKRRSMPKSNPWGGNVAAEAGDTSQDRFYIKKLSRAMEPVIEQGLRFHEMFRVRRIVCFSAAMLAGETCALWIRSDD